MPHLLIRKNKLFLRLIFYYLFLFSTTLLISQVDSYEQVNNLLLDSIKISGSNKYFSDKRIKYDLLNSIHKKLRLNQTITSERSIKRVIDDILEYYTQRGFPFCEIKAVNVLKIEENQNKILLELEANSKDYVSIRFVNFVGNKSCKLDVLLRESRFENLPFKFNPNRIDDARKYLYKTNSFSSIPGYFIVSDMNKKNGYGILISIEEDKYNSIDAILGYSTENKNSNDSEFLGKIDLSFNNLFGTFRKARLGWYRGTQNEEKIELFYEEPWLFTIPLKTGLIFNQDYYDLQYLERKVGLNLDYNLNLNFNLISNFKLINIYPDSALINEDPTIIGNELKQSYSGGFVYTSSFYNKNHLNNEDGISVKIEGGSIKNILKLKSINDKVYYDTDIKLNINFVYNLFKTDKQNSIGVNRSSQNYFENTIFFKNQISYEHIFTENDSMSIYDKFKMGGINSVRGYKEDQFNTISKIFIKNELVFKVDTATKLFMLYDIGFWSEKNRITDYIKDYNLISGLGIGINYIHRLGEMEVSYAYPIEEDFTNGKIHVRYINKF